MTTENIGEKTELTKRHQEAISRIIRDYLRADTKEVRELYLDIVRISHHGIANSVFG